MASNQPSLSAVADASANVETVYDRKPVSDASDRVESPLGQPLEHAQGIPARLFQTWKTKRDIPKRLRHWSASFEAQNQGFLYELWDDADNRSFISREFPWFLDTYDNYPAEIYRADAIRYFYLYTFGGLYADMDTECLRPLDPILTMGDVVLGRMGSDESFPHSVPNAIMASKPRQEFWLLIMALLNCFATQTGRPESQTGSILLKTGMDLYLANDPQWARITIDSIRAKLRADQQPETSRSTIRVLNRGEWFPLNWADPIHLLLRANVMNGRLLDAKTKSVLFGGAWMVTYWAHTWE
jgi:inositol phosphorylceramide mannosyltransferase catalytic subunit